MYRYRYVGNEFTLPSKDVISKTVASLWVRSMSESMMGIWMCGGFKKKAHSCVCYKGFYYIFPRTLCHSFFHRFIRWNIGPTILLRLYVVCVLCFRLDFPRDFLSHRWYPRFMVSADSTYSPVSNSVKVCYHDIFILHVFIYQQSNSALGSCVAFQYAILEYLK